MADTSENASKKRRLPGACDLCKKKKIRCDSGGMAGQRCTNCVNAGAECTHVELTKNLVSARGYVEGLEKQLEKMQALLTKLLPGVDIAEELENGIDSPHDEAEEIPRNDATLSLHGLHLENLMLDPSNKRFFGRSSGLYLIETALHHKKHHVGNRDLEPMMKQEPAWAPMDWQMRYLQYPQPNYEFPPDDLLTSLVDLYFENVNIALPLLHRPTFEQTIAEGAHLSDPFFGGTVLLVCALGARYSNDHRAFSEGPTVPSSAGWQWYVQVPVVRTNLQLSVKPTLYEVQCYALTIAYIKASNVSQSTWVQIGFGLRLAQDVGAHRARNLPHPTAIDQLWTRAFFVLLVFERSIGAFAGRPATIHEEEYDVEFPIDCDDEYWNHPDPEKNYKQPGGTPSKISFFIHYLKLMDLLAYAMRSIYPVRQAKLFSGRPRMQSTQQLIADLDSYLNQWLDAVPEHLKWDPNRRGPFFMQSAILYSSYYYMQCFVHRPFIPMPQNPSSLSFPSLTMCVTAARACGHVAKATIEQNVILPLPQCWNCFFTAAVILLLSTWTGRRSGRSSDAISGVDTCLQIFKMCETRWPAAGRYWDMITEMARVGEAFPTPNHKRARSSENLRDQVQESSNAGAKGPRTIAGSYRVLHATRTPLNGPHNRNPESGSESERIYSTGVVNDSLTLSSNSSPEDLPIQTPPDFFESTADPLLLMQDQATLDALSTGNTFFGDASQVDFDFDGFLSSLSSMDDSTMSMWSATPTGYGEDAWQMYLSDLQSTGVLDGVDEQTWFTVT